MVGTERIFNDTSSRYCQTQSGNILNLPWILCIDVEGKWNKQQAKEMILSLTQHRYSLWLIWS